MNDAKKTKVELVAELQDLRERLARAERVRGDADERMRSLIDLAPVMIWEMDAEGVITLSQGKALEILGYAPGQLAGVDAKALFADDPLISSDIDQMLAGKTMTTTRLMAGRLIEARHIPIRDEHGKVVRVIGVGIDITEQREGETNLRELSDRLSLAQKIARLGSWEWDLSDGRQIWSEENYRIFGVSPETFTPSFDSFLEFVHDDDRHRLRASLNRALADSDTGFNSKHRIVLNDGTVRHVHTRGQVMRRLGGKPLRVIGTCQDITEQILVDVALLQSESRFALFMDHLPAAVMIKNQDGKLLYANKYLREVFSPFLHPTERVTDSLPQDQLTRIRADDRRALKEGQLEREENIPDAAGRYRWMQTIKFAIPQDDAPALLGGVSWDVTERKAAEEALHDSEQRYRSLWDNAPVGLWLEDTSDVVRHLEKLRARGVTDLGAYLDEHPEEVQRCAALARVVSVNQAAVDMNRASDAKELCGHLDTILDARALEVFKQVLLAVNEGRTTLDFESEITTLDGGTRSIAMRLFTPPEFRRTWQETIIAAVDITALRCMEDEAREGEARLQSIFRASPVGVIVSHGDEIDFANPRAADILGCGAGELIGARFDDFHPTVEEHAQALRGISEQMAVHGVGTVETRLRRADGAVLEVLLSGSAIAPDDPGAGVTYAILVMNAH